MKRILFIYLLLLLTSLLNAQSATEKLTEVLFETTGGNIRIALYNDTPLHRDNILKLTREKYYDGLLFHRVIKDFMIQTGDPDSRKALPGEFLGKGGPGYTVPAEIRFPQHYHRKGVLAMARTADMINPQRNSSGSQFYIVIGKRYTKSELKEAQQRLDKQTGGKIKLTDEQKKEYRKKGGTPHLDGQYTIFGEVTEGMKTVMRIQNKEVDENDRPVNNVRIIKATIVGE